MEVRLKAYAKINLSLDVTGRRDDGYHLLKSIMQSVSLCDEITVSERSDGETAVFTSNSMIADDKTNLAYKAAQAFFSATEIAGRGVDISIVKNIPIQAGLAGGSADAAGVLIALDTLFGTSLGKEKIAQIGEKIGADVPFCVMGGTMLCEGIGEIMTSLPDMPDCFIVIAKPQDGVSTAEAYKAVDSLPLGASRPDADTVIRFISGGDVRGIAENIGNIFETAISLDSTAQIRDIMQSCGSLGAVMTGSGSAVFGIFESAEKAADCSEKLKNEIADVFITHPTKFGTELI